MRVDPATILAASIVRDYDAALLASEHAAFAKVSDSERAAVADVEKQVKTPVASEEWKAHEQVWKEFLP